MTMYPGDSATEGLVKLFGKLGVNVDEDWASDFIDMYNEPSDSKTGDSNKWTNP